MGFCQGTLIGVWSFTGAGRLASRSAGSWSGAGRAGQKKKLGRDCYERYTSMSTNAKIAMDVQGLIAQAADLSERLQLLLSSDRQHVNKTKRDGLCLLHWSLIFEHHQGILLLLRRGFYAPAFALMRPLEEAFLRLFVAMNGTENQVAALWKGTYKTEFEVVWRQIYEKVGLEARFEPWLKNKIKALHGFTHGGKEQLVRQASGSDIVSSYTDDEVCSLVRETMPIAFFTALLTTAFLEYPTEHQRAVAMLNEYAQGTIRI